ncbi:hypothetical protein [Vibrio parahaemolyticus]
MIFSIYSSAWSLGYKFKQVMKVIKSKVNKAERYFDNSFPKLSLMIRYIGTVVMSSFHLISLNEISIKINTKKIINKISLMPNRSLSIKYCSSFLSAMGNGNKETIKQVSQCAQQLSETIENYKTKSNRNLLLYPLHIFSDELAIIVALKAVNNELHVISDVKENEWCDKWGDNAELWKNKHQDLILFNPFVKSKREASSEIRKIVKKVRHNEVDFAVFPDAIPEYTRRLGSNHSYIKCPLFGRQAVLHSGPFTFPKLMRSDVLPYFIFIDKGKLRLKTLEPITYENIEDELPIAIENGIRKMYPQWILWHFQSFFYRNG